MLKQSLSKGKGTVIWAITADHHVNSTVGLCPPRVQRDAGGSYQASRAQRRIYENWLDFWDLVEEIAEKEKAESTLSLLLGDLVDKNQHNQTELIVYGNDARIVGAAEEVFDRPRAVSDHLFILRGTEAHVGNSGYLEELLAQNLEATPDEEVGTASWDILPLDTAGVRGDFCHHAQTYGWLPWTRAAACTRQAAIIWADYQKMNEPIPDIAGRAHGHYFDRGYHEDLFCFYTPSWQLTTRYGRRRGAGRRIEPIGGVIVVCRDGEYSWQKKLYKPKARRWWTLAKPNYSES